MLLNLTPHWTFKRRNPKNKTKQKTTYPYLRHGVQLVQRRSEAPASAPHLCVSVEVIVWWGVQSVIAGQSLRSTRRYAALITVTLIITSFIKPARCRPPIGYRHRRSVFVCSQVNTVTGYWQLHDTNACIVVDCSWRTVTVFADLMGKKKSSSADLSLRSDCQGDGAIVQEEGCMRRAVLWELALYLTLTKQEEPEAVKEGWSSEQ